MRVTERSERENAWFLFSTRYLLISSYTICVQINYSFSFCQSDLIGSVLQFRRCHVGDCDSSATFRKLSI